MIAHPSLGLAFIAAKMIPVFSIIFLGSNTLIRHRKRFKTYIRLVPLCSSFRAECQMRFSVPYQQQTNLIRRSLPVLSCYRQSIMLHYIYMLRKRKCLLFTRSHFMTDSHLEQLIYMYIVTYSQAASEIKIF